MTTISLGVALLVANSLLSSGHAKEGPKEYIWELQYWEWEVKRTAGMKDVDPEDIPKNAKVTAVKILRQAESMNFGEVQIRGLKLTYFVLPEKEANEVKKVQVYLSISKENGEEGTSGGGGTVYLPTTKLGKRHFFGGAARGLEKEIIKANAFCVVINESNKNIIQMWNDLHKEWPSIPSR